MINREIVEDILIELTDVYPANIKLISFKCKNWMPKRTWKLTPLPKKCLDFESLSKIPRWSSGNNNMAYGYAVVVPKGHTHSDDIEEVTDFYNYRGLKKIIKKYIPARRAHSNGLHISVEKGKEHDFILIY